jgi:hypothetical protein
MGRSIPLWVLFLCVLLWGLFTIAFGWTVKSSLTESGASGPLGKAAVEIASFPTVTKDVILEVFGYASGDYKDESIRVQREEDADYSDFEPFPTTSAIKVPGLLMRANPAKMSDGWRILVGGFQIDGDIENAVFLISHDLKIVRMWSLDEIPVGHVKPHPKHRKFVHGLEILKDGSLIFTFDDGVSLQRFNACGERQWTIGGLFHHAVTLDDSGESVWTLKNHVIAQVAVEDGSILRRIPMHDVIAKNPMIDILEIRREHPNDLDVNSRNTTGEWMADPIHLNDVEPLPAAIADRFDRFSAGDLLISARSLNLVFVLDPETLKIKWWRIGATQRQHDPDWLANGEIMVLNNRMSRDFSEIVSIDPDSFERTVMFDGRRSDFYTRIRGKHQLLDNGMLVVTSPQQGRAFEVGRDGETVFEVVNQKPGSETTNYVISELRWLPRDYFDVETWQCPKAE